MTTQEMKKVALALQGGGSHGAFTWGVLEGLLDDGRIQIEGISGTSAGAMNGVVLAHALEKEGPEEAKAALESFWSSISGYGAFSPYHSGPFNPWGADWSPNAIWFDFISQIYSPYQLNPFNINPLRNVLENSIDFEFLRHCQKIQLFISATNVRNNHLHLFTNKDMSIDVLLASACLPYLNQAVQIGQDYFWDGGFMGNPVLEPLIRRCQTPDTLIVQINPTHRENVPVTAHEIADRLNEITFNASLMREIRSYADITRLIEKGIVQDPRVQRAYFHLIGAEDEMAHWGVLSKLDTSWSFLTRLRDIGKGKAVTWLDKNFHHLGTRSTIDLAAWTPVEYGERTTP